MENSTFRKMRFACVRLDVSLYSQSEMTKKGLHCSSKLSTPRNCVVWSVSPRGQFVFPREKSQTNGCCRRPIRLRQWTDGDVWQLLPAKLSDTATTQIAFETRVVGFETDQSHRIQFCFLGSCSSLSASHQTQNADLRVICHFLLLVCDLAVLHRWYLEAFGGFSQRGNESPK